MSNPNEECRKGKKDAVFKLGQEVYTIKISQNLDGFKFAKWNVCGLWGVLSESIRYYLFKNDGSGNPDIAYLCPDSIFETPQEAAEELHDRLAKLNRMIEIVNYPDAKTRWEDYIV